MNANHAVIAHRAVQLMHMHERQDIAQSRKAALEKAKQLLTWNDNDKPSEDAVNEVADALQRLANDALGLVDKPRAPYAAPAMAAPYGDGSLPSAPGLQPLGKSSAPWLPSPQVPSIQAELGALHQDLLKLDDALNSLVTDLDPILRPPAELAAPGPCQVSATPAPAGSSLLASVLDGRRHAQKLLADVQALRDQINL